MKILSPKTARKTGYVFKHLILIIISFCMIFPVLWTISTSLKTQDEMFRYPPVWIPKTVQWKNYVDVIRTQRLPRYMLNSLIVSGGSVIVTIIIGSLAGYGFSRFSFKGQYTLLFLILATMMIPGLTNMIPLYSIMTSLKLLDTYAVLIIIYVAWMTPFTVWIMKSFFDSIPKDLEDAALIDGCNRIQLLMRIVVPIAKPGLVAAVVLNFVNGWNEFLTALIFTSSNEMRTVSVGIYNFLGFYRNSYGPLAAASILVIIPVVTLFLILRERFMKGMIEGAIKG